jgi:hypothetical protein
MLRKVNRIGLIEVSRTGYPLRLTWPGWCSLRGYPAEDSNNEANSFSVLAAPPIIARVAIAPIVAASFVDAAIPVTVAVGAGSVAVPVAAMAIV